MTPWPLEIDAGGGVALRAADPIDAEAITDAVHESLDELRPWMPWAADPISIDQQAVRLAVLAEAMALGGDAGYTVVADGDLAGYLGVHDRLGDPTAREIGYWLRTSAAGRGTMTGAVLAMAGVLADRGFTRAEIHCHEHNLRSAAVAARCGFTYTSTTDASMTWVRLLRPPP